MSPIPIDVAKLIANDYGYDQVVIIARRVGDAGCEHVTTYGRDRVHCEVAARIGDYLKFKVMDWTKDAGDRCICCGRDLPKMWHGPACEECTAVADDVHDLGTGYAMHTAEGVKRLAPETVVIRPAAETPARADAEALAAVPSLKGKNALVLYFPTKQDADEFAAAILTLKPGMRAVHL